MRTIARICVDDDESQEEITIYASMNNGVYDVVLSNGDYTGLRSCESLEGLEYSVEAAWGNWFTFRWLSA